MVLTLQTFKEHITSPKFGYYVFAEFDRERSVKFVHVVIIESVELKIEELELKFLSLHP